MKSYVMCVLHVKTCKTLPFYLSKTGTVGNILFRQKCRDQLDWGGGGGFYNSILICFGFFFVFFFLGSVCHRRHELTCQDPQTPKMAKSYFIFSRPYSHLDLRLTDKNRHEINVCVNSLNKLLIKSCIIMKHFFVFIFSSTILISSMRSLLIWLDIIDLYLSIKVLTETEKETKNGVVV